MPNRGRTDYGDRGYGHDRDREWDRDREVGGYGGGYGGMGNIGAPAPWRDDYYTRAGVGGGDRDRDAPRPSWRGHGPQGYTRSDARIYEDLCDRLTDDHDVDAREIDVKVASGDVTLTGRVPDRAMKYRAEEIAEQVTGVKEIDNQIRVYRGDREPDAPKRKGGASA